MQKCMFSLFLCVCLASCTPKIVSGVQDVQALEQHQRLDSVAMSHLLDVFFQEYSRRHLERYDSRKTETVREILSDPDSSGCQYVVERSTTRINENSSLRAASSSSSAKHVQEQTDSIAISDSVSVVAADLHEELESTPELRSNRFFFITGLIITIIAILGCIYLAYFIKRRISKWSR